MSDPDATSRSTRVAFGADSCPGGWVVVRLDDGAVGDVEVVDLLAEVVGYPHDAIAIDIPIGLLDVARDADRAARQLLPGRASSVFSAPPRSLLDAWRRGEVTSHAEASALASKGVGTGISQQAWRLIPKIAEVDGLVARGATPLEVHPEVAFALLAGGPLPSKRSWAGVTTRRAVLERVGIDLPDRFPGDEAAGPDDVLDAAVCAWVADGAARGEPLIPIPERTDQCAAGRPVVMHARRGPPVVPGPRRAPRRPIERR